MKIIAYYLPQYYPFPENNNWWGNGFTEWTNVGKAKRLFYGHYQPKVPADLGYYDLRLSEIREEQARLAKIHGIHGFCYWHYWFGGGKRLLDMPINQVLNEGKPDFPFCLGWANESWKAKVWNSEDRSKDQVLIKQDYPGEKDILDHFNYVSQFIVDKRYLKMGDKPIFVVYKPLELPNPQRFISSWNALAKNLGFKNGFHFVGHTINPKEVDEILSVGFNAVNIVRIGEHKFNKEVILKNALRIFKYKYFRRPLILDYKEISKYFVQKLERSENVYPTLIPNWDHTPRSGKRGMIFHKSNPQLFKNHVEEVLKCIENKELNNQIVFLKSWNEWGEGNYMEPDLRFKDGYLKALKDVVIRHI